MSHCLYGIFREERWDIFGTDRPMWFFELIGDTVWGAGGRRHAEVGTVAHVHEGRFDGHLVEITAYSDEDAYTIFETMNDRGLSLTPTDMLKGYLLANITEPISAPRNTIAAPSAVASARHAPTKQRNVVMTRGPARKMQAALATAVANDEWEEF